MFLDCSAFYFFLLALAVACGFSAGLPMRNPSLGIILIVVAVVLSVIAAFLSLACPGG